MSPAQRVITVEELRALQRSGTKVRLAGRDQAPQLGKYGNTGVTWGGMRFSSRAELAFHLYLLWLQRRGLVLWFTRQVPFYLPGKPESTERCKKYVCDFLVVMADGRTRVVDVKGEETQVFKIKQAWLHKEYNFRIELVVARTEGDYSWV